MAYTDDKKPLELTELTSLEDADAVVVGDQSDAVEVAKYITWANIKAAIKTYIEGLASYFNVSSDTSDVITEGASNLFMTTAERSKLSGIETNATANPNALENVVEDTTPQLGGDLDVNGHAIGSTSNGDIEITPNGTGIVYISSNIQVVDTRGIIDGNGQQLLAFDGIATAVNYLSIYNATSANAPSINALGSATNIGIKLVPKGTGNVVLGTLAIDGDQTVGAGQDTYILVYDHSIGAAQLKVNNSWKNTDGTSANMTVSTTEPTSPAVKDVWIDLN